jgi:hypothetical protein
MPTPRAPTAPASTPTISRLNVSFTTLSLEWSKA